MNPILQKTQDAVMQKADPRLAPVIKKLVEAGKKIMYSEQTQELTFEALGDGTDPEVIGSAVAKLVGMLYNQSKNTAPMQALIPAAVVLLCEGLDFLEQAGTVEATPDFLAQCTMAMGSSVAQLFGVTPDKLQGLVDKSGKGGQQPAPAGGILTQGAM